MSTKRIRAFLERYDQQLRGTMAGGWAHDALDDLAAIEKAAHVVADGRIYDDHTEEQVSARELFERIACGTSQA
jgi:hypothetical protein